MYSKSEKHVEPRSLGFGIFSLCFIYSKYQGTKFKYDLSKTSPSQTTLSYSYCLKPCWPRLCPLGVLRFSILCQASGWLGGKESICQRKRCAFSPWEGKIPCRRKWQLALVFLPGKFHGQWSLVVYSPWGCKSQTWAFVCWKISHYSLNFCAYDGSVKIFHFFLVQFWKLYFSKDLSISSKLSILLADSCW